MSEIQAKAEKSLIPAVMNETDLRSLVYVIRGQQVMLDSDLAALYQVCLLYTSDAADEL